MPPRNNPLREPFATERATSRPGRPSYLLNTTVPGRNLRLAEDNCGGADGGLILRIFRGLSGRGRSLACAMSSFPDPSFLNCEAALLVRRRGISMYTGSNPYLRLAAGSCKGQHLGVQSDGLPRRVSLWSAARRAYEVLMKRVCVSALCVARCLRVRSVWFFGRAGESQLGGKLSLSGENVTTRRR